MNPLLARKVIQARDALQHPSLEIVRNGNYDSVFKGYFASLGPTLVSNGLLPAFLMFEKDAQDKSAKVSKLFSFLLSEGSTAAFSNYLLEANRHSNYQVLREVADYTVAIKLALSTFKSIESN